MAPSVRGTWNITSFGRHDSPVEWDYTFHLQERSLRLKEVATCPAGKEVPEDGWYQSPSLTLMSTALSQQDDGRADYMLGLLSLIPSGSGHELHDTPVELSQDSRQH